MTTLAQNAKQEERIGLFRKQAVEKQQDRLLGDVLVIPPLSYSLITLVLIVIVAATLVLLFNGTYARKETVQGYLVPDKGVVHVFAETGGIVRQVLVEEGAMVEEGQPLFVINGDRVLESGEHLEDLLLAEYQTQQKLLNQQLTQLPEDFSSQRTALNQREQSIEQDVRHLSRQLELLNAQADVAERQWLDAKRLYDGGLTTRTGYDTALEKHLAIQSEQQSLQRMLDTQRSELDALALQLSALQFDENNQQAKLRNQLSSLAQQIAQLHGQRAYVVKASKAGTVSSVQIREGQEAATGKPLMTITPEGSTLMAELLVPTRAIGFIEKGQSVKIRYSAYSYQKFGLYEAKLSQVSQSVLLPEELNAARIGVHEPMYRVLAELGSQAVDAYGKALPLKAGIALEADVELAERTLIEWLLEPLFSLTGRL